MPDACPASELPQVAFLLFRNEGTVKDTVYCFVQNRLDAS